MGTIKLLLIKNSYEYVTREHAAHEHAMHGHIACLHQPFIVFRLLSNPILREIYLRFLYAQFKKSRILC